MVNRHCTLLFTALFAGSTTHAQTSETPKEVGTTRVVVAALKDDRVAEEAATSLTQLSSEMMDRTGASNLQNALKYESGVTMDVTSSGRIDNVKIRGVGDNRVMLAVDGAPLPGSFAFQGGYADIGLGYFDIDAMKSIDIVKGPVSMLYGSSALAGGIFMETKDPEDFIQAGKRYGGEVKVGYNTADRDRLTTLTGAAKLTDDLSAFVRTTFRKHYERENYHGKAFDEHKFGDERLNPNASESNVKNLLTKVVYEPSGMHKFSLSYEYFNDHTWGSSLDRIGEKTMNMPMIQTTFADHSTSMKNTRNQLNVRHDFDVETPVFDRGHWMAYYQETKARQLTIEERNSPATKTRPAYVADRWRTTNFDSKTFGLNLELFKGFETGTVYHDVSYGATYKHQKFNTVRWGDTVKKDTGISIETQPFPAQSFPDSTVNEYGLFVQDRIGFLDNTIEVILGLRYDHYELKSKKSGGYYEATPGAIGVNLNEGHLSKRLAVLYYPTETQTLYANYAEGFKAPRFDEINTAFGNADVKYIVRSNPNLKPEKSQNFELGWNFNNDVHTASVAAFYSKYTDFIQSQQLVGVENGAEIYQSINLNDSYIYGLEAKTSLRMMTVQNGDGEIRFNGNIAYAKGKDKKTKEPIDSIEPLTAVLGLGYSHSDTTYIGLNWKLVAPKNGSSISQRLQDLGVKRMSGYGTLDLVAEYKPMKNVRINGGIYNLLDKKYWNWNNRMGQTNRFAVERGTEPGINAGISVTINF